MATEHEQIRYLRVIGDVMRVHYKDGVVMDAYPNGNGLYLPRKVATTITPPPDPDPDPGDWSHPAPGANLTSPYGDRPGGFHYGIDLSSTTAAVGVPVLAVTNMTITTAVDAYEGGNSTAGTYVKGNNGAQTFSYAHGADGSLAVSAGQNVTKGTVLFMEGATGNVTGTHLHFEIYDTVHPDPWAGYPIYPGDPAPILASHGVTIS